MGSDYSSLGFDQFLRPTALKHIEPRRVSTFEFDSQYEIAGRNVKLSSVSVDSLVQQSGYGTATGSGYANGGSFVVTGVIKPIGPNYLSASRMHLACPYVNIFEGTVEDTDFQIYPRIGGSISNGDYECMAGYDTESASFNGVNVTFAVTVKVIAAGTVDVMAIGVWQYTANNYGSNEV